jgi:hypothetical protein
MEATAVQHSVDRDNELTDGDAPDVVTRELQRRGNVEKCPVCGSRVDAEAFHCPTCHNYFCFHCRARLLPPDTQLQCANQDCRYYDKMIFGVCEESHEKEEPPVVFAEPEDGYWPAWLAVVLVCGVLIWSFASFWATGGIALAAFAGGGYLLHRAGLNIFGRERQVEQRRKSSYHTCINCEKPVRELGRAPRTGKSHS